jgi:hypothetical protein
VIGRTLSHDQGLDTTGAGGMGRALIGSDNTWSKYKVDPEMIIAF